MRSFKFSLKNYIIYHCYLSSPWVHRIQCEQIETVTVTGDRYMVNTDHIKVEKISFKTGHTLKNYLQIKEATC